ncbi:RepB family plasmid replication initiator protein [Moraxella catarrhalis]|uniref:RepB family plasmid replication initiator protein n=2 Tax=Moraxella catarrhalis TaxID=480 RepID=UPI00128CD1AA|nr:RepB family plasmid replication initiator protein [Moraxella catarrhalis]MPW47581.1 RepB family plasmid replication initiator protein [Moraxella catarrhalis]MPW49279.1 RepB family plasmid replication initiator protein [Moraxella catarrhalis]
MERLFTEKVDKSLSVIKHNTLVEAGYHLSPVPHNLMTLAVTKVKRSEIGLPDHDKTGEVVVTADEYAKIHGIDIRTAYKDLKKAVLELENASIRCDAYYDFNATSRLAQEQRTDIALNSDRYHSNVIIGTKPKHGNYAKMKLHIKLVDRVGYSEEGSFVYFRFSDDVMYLIDNSEIDYTAYPYDKTIDMNITPMKRMYEMACKWAKVGTCKKSVDDWRHFFGLVDKYEKIAEFKRWVIEPAIKGVNKQGEFELTLEQQKLGKTITHLIVKIKDKRPNQAQIESKDKDPNIPSILHGLTDKELAIVHQKVADYIVHLESKGELVNDFHRKNIEQKAIADRWGLDEHYEQLQKAENERLARKEQAEREKQAKLAEQAEKQRQEAENAEFIAYFERLPQDEQTRIIDEVQKLINPVMQSIFDKDTVGNTAYKNPMVRHYFRQVMGV